MSVKTWYHGTDTTETASTIGLDSVVTLNTPGSDDRGFFMTADEPTARLYAVGKTIARIALGEIPPASRAVVIAAKDSAIGSFLEEPEFPLAGERFIPLANYPQVPQDVFSRIWTG